jgi:hypothetical protein
VTGFGKLGCDRATRESCFLTPSALSSPIFQELRSFDFFTLWNDTLLQAFYVFDASESLYFTKNKAHTFVLFVLLEGVLYVYYWYLGR